jgi:regulator of RNase E activity RraA
MKLMPSSFVLRCGNRKPLVPGDMAFGDIDGVVVIPQAVAGTAIRAALDKVAAEDSTRAALLEGKSLREVYARFRVL